MLTGFTHRKISVAGCDIDLQLAGEGSPILCLHGFPENKLAWHKVAPELAVTHTVILPDLPGYGDSTAPPADAEYRNCSKRAVGNILVEVMHRLGFEHFAVAGHDRGGRVAYRMALDHPQKVSQLVVLNIIPTLDMAERFTYITALQFHNWFLMAQPAPFPETLLEKNSDYYLQHIIETWADDPARISPEAKAEYVRCFRKREVLEAICSDYRATIWDIENDQADRDKNKRIECPMHVLWSKDGFASTIGDPVEVWHKWADKVTGTALHGGHFLMEECPNEVLEQCSHFLAASMGIEV